MNPLPPIQHPCTHHSLGSARSDFRALPVPPEHPDRPTPAGRSASSSSTRVRLPLFGGHLGKGTTMPDTILPPNQASSRNNPTPPTGHDIGPPLAFLAALTILVLLVLLTGCAHTRVDGYDPYGCNWNTDYPSIGGLSQPTPVHDPGTTEPRSLRPARRAPEEEVGFSSRPEPGPEFPRIDPHAYDLGRDQRAFPRIDPHEY